MCSGRGHTEVPVAYKNGHVRPAQFLVCEACNGKGDLNEEVEQFYK